jgi:3-hydroxyisobutyrate dehydrogenase-like beta-hydroxyacid dehydrogenase
MKKIGFIGLGVMGFNIANHLLNNFDCLNIVARNSNRTKKFIKANKKNKKLNICNSISELANESNIIISCVGNDNDLKKIYMSRNSVFDNISNGTIIIDHTTASASYSKVLYKNFLQKNSYFFDAPVSGGEIGSLKGTLSIMLGGNSKKKAVVKQISSCYAKSIVYMGKSGNGQLTKMVNQICVSSVIQGIAEGLYFAKKKKLNISSLLNVIANGAGQSWQFDNRAETMWKNKFNFGFMNKHMLKDLKLVLEESKKSQINLPVTKIIKGFYTILVRNGFSKEDTSNLIRLLK